MCAESKIIKVGLSFYADDAALQKKRISELKQAGVNIRGGTLIRALVYLATPAAMIESAMGLLADYAKKVGPRESEDVAHHPSVDFPKDQVDKLDAIVDQLYRRGVTTTRTFLVRALLRATPAGKTLAPEIKRFLAENPPKPSGWTARNAKQNA